MKMIAIIGASASGKSDLAFKVAKKFDGYILSLDSLSVYKNIDIVSAKPTKEQMQSVRHFGIDNVCADESFSIMDFIDVYREAKEIATRDNKLLIIAGGSSFYLKSMIDGLSKLPQITEKIKEKAKLKSKNIETAYEFLYKLDKSYMRSIKPNDRYRITRAYEIYLSTNETMTTYFEKNPRIKVIDGIDIFNLHIEKEELAKRVRSRTIAMLENGLLDEIKFLKEKYSDNLSPMKSIGIKETLLFLNNEIDMSTLREDIVSNTMKLAKRQKTFNKTQFSNVVSGSYEELFDAICNKLE